MRNQPFIGKRRVLLSLGLAAAAAIVLPAAASAQTYPDRVVRLIVPQSPGSGMDLFARQIGAKLSQAWGQQVVVDNRPGANAAIGMAAAAKAAPDGYTLAMAAPSPMTINQHIYKDLPYDPLRDFEPVAQIASITFGLVVTPALGIASAEELAARARQRPGEMNYASSGTGNLNQLAAELFSQSAKLKMTHVPYRGEAPALQAVMTGEAHLMFTPLPAAAPLVRSGQLRLIGTTGTARDPSFPDVRTLTESGFPEVVVAGWTGVIAPAGTPKEIIDRVAGEIARQIATPDMREQFAKQGSAVVLGTPEQFRTLIHAEAQKWGKLIADTGIKLAE